MYFEFVFGTVLCIASGHGTTTEEPTINDSIYRLSGDVVPLSYILKIAPYIQTSTFTGSVDIIVEPLVPINKIELHSRQLDITECKVTEKGFPFDNQIHLDAENELLIIELQQELQAERLYNVSINFQGTFSSKRNGLLKGSYKNNRVTKWLAFTQFEPTHARSAFPCFDEPRYKAPFTIYIERDIHQNAISNMPLKKSVNSSIENRVWDEFETSPPMPTYVVAFVISEFKHIEANNKLVALWMRENSKHKFDHALRESVRCLEQIEKMVGISYTLPKLDIVSIPTNFNSQNMENWGLITFLENYINAKDSDDEFSKRLQSAIQCHEISHQWFGDLVTPAWWDYLWLKDGFATYYQYFAQKEIKPSYRSDEWFTIESIAFSLWEDNRVERALTVKVNKKTQLRSIYDTITYDKGAAILRMLEHISSPQVFRKFTHTLLTRQDEQNGLITQDDFLNVLEEEINSNKVHLPANTTISQIMKTWTENTGYPLITVTRDFPSQTVTFTQTTYKTPRAREPQPNQQWIIPLTYTTGSQSHFGNSTPTLWSFAKQPVQIQVSSLQWILCNLQRSGYYRVNYDLYNWELLIGQLLINHEKIPPASRAQLLDDAFAMAYDDIISYMIPIQMSLYLPKDDDDMPWYAVLFHLEKLSENYQSKGSKFLFNKYVQRILKNKYQRLGFQPKPDDNASTRLLRPKLLQLACAVQLPECVQNALFEYKNHKRDLSKIHPDLKPTVFLIALRYVRDLQMVQNELLSLYEKSDDNVDKDSILTAAVHYGSKQFLNKIFSQTTEEQITESKNKRNNLDALIPSKIFLAYLHHINDGITQASDLKEDQVSSIESILSKIDAGVQADVLLNLLHNFKNKLAKFQNKYVSMIESIDHLYYSSTKISRVVQNNTKKLKTILEDVTATFPDKMPFE